MQAAAAAPATVLCASGRVCACGCEGGIEEAGAAVEHDSDNRTTAWCTSSGYQRGDAEVWREQRDSMLTHHVKERQRCDVMGRLGTVAVSDQGNTKHPGHTGLTLQASAPAPRQQHTTTTHKQWW